MATRCRLEIRTLVLCRCGRRQCCRNAILVHLVSFCLCFLVATRRFTNTEGGPTMGEMKEFASLFYREGALDAKTKALVALTAMAAAGCTS